VYQSKRVRHRNAGAVVIYARWDNGNEFSLITTDD
jgi:hypothetical protein